MPNHKHRIVVVDDDEGMNHAMERLLNAAGFSALSFASAEALLDADAARTADCLVLDIHLPGLSGFDLGFHLRQNGCRTPIIFITAHEDSESRKRAQAGWATCYLIKPFQGHELLAAINKAVEFKELEKAR